MTVKISSLPRWLRFSVLGFLGLVLVGWLLARFWLPEFARQKAVAVLSETLHRPVSIGEIDIQPFAFGVAVKQFSIGQRDAAQGAAPLFAFDALQINLSSSSLWQRAPVISRLTLVRPNALLVREADGRFNFSDLLESKAGTPAESTSGLPEFSLSNISVINGQFSFDDRQQNTRQTLSELTLGVPFAGTIGTQEESWIEPHLSVRLDGALFELKGKLKPFADRREAIVAVHLKDLDLTRVMAYVPPTAGLSLQSGRLDIDLDLSFVQAPGKPFSLVVAGDTAVRQLALENRGGGVYVVAADRIGVKLNELDASLQKPVKADLTLENLSVRPKASKVPLLALPRLAVGNAQLDLKARRVSLAAVELDNLQIVLRREKDGQIDLLRLLMPPASLPQRDSLRSPKKSPDATLPKASSRATAAAAEPWQGSIGKLALKDAGLRFADETVDKAPPLTLEGLALALENIDIRGQKPATLELAATVNRRGRIATKGTVAWAPLAVALTLDVKDVELVPLQGWVGDKLNAVLSRGAFSVQGQLDLAGEPLVAKFSGDGKLGGFNLFDPKNAADVLNFRSIDLAGLKFVSAPLALDLQRLTLDEVFARAILGVDGQLNLKQLVKSDPPPASPPVPGSPSAPADKAQETSKETPVKIGEIIVKKSRVDFTDRFIKPPYSASLSGLEGKVTALAAGQRGLIDLRGMVDRSAPLAISGELDPFGTALFLNVVARVKGVDMPAISPYAERYLGYEISKGKLSFDVKYFVENNQLKAENALFLDQLTFGNKVDSPEALSVPVTLAVALLKNTRGEIDLNLPLSGSLSDPEFSVARIVFKVLGNLIVKAVTSPFALLGSAFGGAGEELSQVDFASGRAGLDAEAEKRLKVLAKALLERPGLTLEITGYADAAHDRTGLAAVALDRRLKALKLAASEQKGQDSAALRDIVLSPEERLAGLRTLAREQGLSLAKDALPAAYESALAEKLKVGDDELHQLAERRGRGVRNWLVETGAVPVERVFVMNSRLDAPDAASPTTNGGGAASPAGRAVFSLR